MLVILCGIPCAGKTQLAIYLAKNLEINYGLDTIVVDPDKIREMIPALTSRFDAKREYLVEALALAIVDESLKRHNIVISDDLNYFESRRHRLVQIAKRRKTTYAIIYLTVSVETAMERNATRGMPIPQELIIKIAKEFDKPGAKYKWDRPDLVLNSERVTLGDAQNQALQMLLERIKEKPRNVKTRLRKPGSTPEELGTSYKKALDESTRIALNELMSSGEMDPSRSREANNMRRAFVLEASDKDLSIEEALKQFRTRIREKLR